MGQVYFSGKGDPSQAASFVQRCVDFSPDNVSCHYLLGRTQMRTDQLPAAAESFAKAIQLGSTSAQHYWWAARAQIDLGNCARAVEYLEPGYERAQEEGDASLITAYQDIMPLCGMNSGVTPAETPTATPEGDQA
jgi:predicted Zn-dependent protease